MVNTGYNLFLTFVLRSSRIKKYIITGLINNLFNASCKRVKFFCRKENTISFSYDPMFCVLIVFAGDLYFNNLHHRVLNDIRIQVGRISSVNVLI